MNDLLLAEFSGAEALLRAAQQGRQAGIGLVDAFSPYPVDGLAGLMGETSTTLRVAMFIGGTTAAALCYGLEWWSAVISYPIDSGGRPLHSWPAFVMFPVAFGILAAAVTGLAALLVASGLPRLHHPLFAIDGFARASQDRFLLAIAAPAREDERQRARDLLRTAGADAIWEIER
jgi:hypothetical protein